MDGSVRDFTGLPDQMTMVLPDLDGTRAAGLARQAVLNCRLLAPKMSGASARRFLPVSGPGYFGVRWVDSYVWFQERGIKAFTMNKLQGKTIPMWVPDPDGKLQRANKKIEKKTTADGRHLVLIFRKASIKGQRKTIMRGGKEISVPRSYPGAPGRIATRMPNGQIGRTNVGVRWRHPGLDTKGFLHRGLIQTAQANQILPGLIYASQAAR